MIITCSCLHILYISEQIYQKQQDAYICIYIYAVYVVLVQIINKAVGSINIKACLSLLTKLFLLHWNLMENKIIKKIIIIERWSCVYIMSEEMNTRLPAKCSMAGNNVMSYQACNCRALPLRVCQHLQNKALRGLLDATPCLVHCQLQQ